MSTAIATDLHDPLEVLALGTSFAEAKVVLTALDMDVFGVLGEGEMTEAELAQRLGIDPRPAPAFFGLLAVAGLLHIREGRLRNSSAARHYLVRGRPSYVGGFLQRADRVLYPAWEKFGEALRTGRPQTGQRVGNPFDELTEVPAEVLSFLDMMDAMNSQVGPRLTRAFDWSAVGTVTDLGGARGNLAATLVAAHPHLRATVFDLPAMKAAFADHVAMLGVADRVDFVAGDFFTDSVPGSDVVVIGHVLHDWSDERAQQILAKAYAALPSGGRVLIYDPMLTAEPKRLNLMVSLHMLLTTEAGREYPVATCESWLSAAGFTDVTSEPIGRLDTLVTGRKP